MDFPGQDLNLTTKAVQDSAPGDELPTATNTGRHAQSTESKGNGPTAQQAGSSKLRTVQRAVSPPPLRGRAAATGDTIGPSHSRQYRPGAVKEPPKQSNGKAVSTESLNPRQLSKPPASHPFRLTVVTKLHDEFVRLNDDLARLAGPESSTLLRSKGDLVKFALDTEEKVAKEEPLVYSNVVKHRIMAYKKMKVEEWKKKLEEEAAETTKITTDGRRDPPVIETGLTPQDELAVLPQLQNTLDGLDKYGYVVRRPSDTEIMEARRGVEAARGLEECDRCKTRFQVFPGRRDDGLLASGGKCIYHWGKAVLPPKRRDDVIKGHVEKMYTCCNTPLGGSAGCTTAATHVVKFTEVKRLAEILQFEETPPNPRVSSTQALCLDCEMCYTVYGLELVRMTATTWPGREEVLDVLVRPMGEVLDLNSRFSGVWPDQIANAKPYEPGAKDGESLETSCQESSLSIMPSMAAARSLVFEHLSPTTPLIGHGLENDLNALRIIHPVIVDSALLFRHPRGLPFRNSLKMLVSKHLERDIQMADDKLGHDSKEDARAAGDLVRWAVGQRWKKLNRQGWTLVEGNLLPPPSSRPSIHGGEDDAQGEGVQEKAHEERARARE